MTGTVVSNTGSSLQFTYRVGSLPGDRTLLLVRPDGFFATITLPVTYW
jgi:hypothetical protein